MSNNIYYTLISGNDYTLASIIDYLQVDGTSWVKHQNELKEKHYVLFNNPTGRCIRWSHTDDLITIKDPARERETFYLEVNKSKFIMKLMERFRFI